MAGELSLIGAAAFEISALELRRGGMSMAKIAAEFEVSVRTLYRHMPREQEQ